VILQATTTTAANDWCKRNSLSTDFQWHFTRQISFTNHHLHWRSNTLLLSLFQVGWS